MGQDPCRRGEPSWPLWPLGLILTRVAASWGCAGLLNSGPGGLIPAPPAPWGDVQELGMQREKFPWEKGINLHPPPPLRCKWGSSGRCQGTSPSLGTSSPTVQLRQHATRKALITQCHQPFLPLHHPGAPAGLLPLPPAELTPPGKPAGSGHELLRPARGPLCVTGTWAHVGGLEGGAERRGSRAVGKDSGPRLRGQRCAGAGIVSPSLPASLSLLPSSGLGRGRGRGRAATALGSTRLQLLPALHTHS